MTLERVAHGVVLASFAERSVPSWLRRRIDAGLGGVCLFAGNDIEPIDGTLVAVDEEGGDVTRLWATTGSPVPGNAALGAVDDVDLTARVSAALGGALFEAGVDLVLAPVADVNSDPDNPVIGVRSFGADEVLVARHVAASVRGLQSAGVAACAKHFPGHGATSVDSHLALPTIEMELEPFVAAIGAGVAYVMTGHLLVRSVDDVPATLSRRLTTGLLRDELGFDGAVVTDALDMEGVGGPSAIPASVVRALAAGADLCCLGSDATDELVGACVDAIVGAVHSGALHEQRLHDAVERVSRIRRTPTAPAGDVVALGAEAARRALRVDGTLPPDLDRAHVVELDRPAMIAAGSVPWRLDIGSTRERLDDVDAALARAEGRPIVIVVRDAHRVPDQARRFDALLAARPDAVVIDIGWPSARRAQITTFGASAASMAAVQDLVRSTTVG